MNPNDMSCVYSTLRFVATECKRHEVTPILTFDQPLWWKGQLIIANEPAGGDLHALILRLGGFHAEMSFLGCIGSVMAASGLEELLGEVFAPNTVKHVLSGKALARAVRGHMLVDSALSALITEQTFPAAIRSEASCGEPYNTIYQTTESTSVKELRETQPETGNDLRESLVLTDRIVSREVTVATSVRSEQTFPAAIRSEASCGETNNTMYQTTESTSAKELRETQPETDNDLQESLVLYDQIVAGEVTAATVCSEKVLDRIAKKVDDQKAALSCHPTARLWLQYMDMVALLRQFIKAERTGNWALHLHSLQEMLPYYAAAGHNSYAKSVHIYLQQMLRLQTQHPDVHASFNSGLHVIRRTDRYWAGLSSDLVIEQVLMRSMKSTGGLTRGRGMGEAQRTRWLLAMPACADINSAMQELTDTTFITSEQHKDASNARQTRDNKDSVTLLGFLQDRNPFSPDPSLRNIVTGVVAEDRVNAADAKKVGKAIVDTMEGMDALTYTFKRNRQVVTMAHKLSVKVDDGTIHVDPQLLFQRLILVAGRVVDNVEDIFKYELCAYPAALFDASGFLREANKPPLADAIWAVAHGDDTPVLCEDESASMTYVLDGGSLLQRLPWQKEVTFDDLCQSYVDYVRRKYGTPTIVFDGYDTGPSTKDMTHLRRTRCAVSAKVNFSGGMPLKSTKEHFLSNNVNKQKFIIMLGEKLEDAGCKTIHAREYAYTMMYVVL